MRLKKSVLCEKRSSSTADYSLAHPLLLLWQMGRGWGKDRTSGDGADKTVRAICKELLGDTQTEIVHSKKGGGK